MIQESYTGYGSSMIPRMDFNSAFPSEGKDDDDVIKEISESLRNNELLLEIENVFAPQWCPADPICNKVSELALRLNSNLFAPSAFPTFDFALQKSLKFLCNTLHGDETVTGQITTGSTEGLFVGLQLAREYFSKQDIYIIASRSAHLSVKKLATYGGVPKGNLLWVDLNEDLSPRLEQIEYFMSKYSPNMMICTAGTTDFGTIDPIEKIAKMCRNRNTWLHVDAAFGGMYLPFLNHQCQFDFSLSEVKSITLDLHKTIGAPIPCSYILSNQKDTFEKLSIEADYTKSLGSRKALSGSYPGISAVQAYAILEKHGNSGLRALVQHCEKLKNILFQNLSTIKGVEVFKSEHLPLLAISCQKQASVVKNDLLDYGVYVEDTSYEFRGRTEWVRIGISNHNTEESIQYLYECIINIIG